MDRYGISVQYRHLALLADVITHNGYLMAISRHGINRIATGPLSKATFEEMADMLIEAAAGAKTDDLNGISARIILGLKGKCGTGSFDLYYPSSLSKDDQIETFKKQLEEFKTEEQNKKLKVDPLDPFASMEQFQAQKTQPQSRNRTQNKSKKMGATNSKKQKTNQFWSVNDGKNDDGDEVVANYLNRSPEYYNDNDAYKMDDIGSIQREDQEKDPFDYL